MKLKTILAAGAVIALAAPASAQLEPYTDYQVDEGVWDITTVKVDANMSDVYLEGIRETWVASNEVAKALGYIETYVIFESLTPGGGDFNMMLAIKYPDVSMLAPSKERYDAFMQAWGEQRQQASRDTAQSYPDMREITGQYLMQELTIAPDDAQ